MNFCMLIKVFFIGEIIIVNIINKSFRFNCMVKDMFGVVCEVMEYFVVVLIWVWLIVVMVVYMFL